MATRVGPAVMNHVHAPAKIRADSPAESWLLMRPTSHAWEISPYLSISALYNFNIQPAMARPISSGESSWTKWTPATVTSACAGVALSDFHVRHLAAEDPAPLLLARKCCRDHITFSFFLCPLSD